MHILRRLIRLMIITVIMGGVIIGFATLNRFNSNIISIGIRGMMFFVGYFSNQGLIVINFKN